MNIVKENINFERGLKPKAAMSIGTFADLRKHSAQQYIDDENFEGNLPEVLEYVLNDGGLDKDKQLSYIKVLLERVPFSEFNEEVIIGLHDLDFDLVPYLKKLPDSSFIHTLENDTHIIKTDEWENFMDVITYNERIISKEFLAGVLKGDAYEYFEDYDFRAYKDNFDVSLPKTNLKQFEDVYKIAKKYDKTFKVKNVDELFNKIWEKAEDEDDENFTELKHAIIKSICETISAGREWEAFNHITKTILSNYNMEYLKEKSGQWLIFEINATGLNNLIYAMFMNDYKFEYKAPYNGEYYGKFDVSVFIDCLDGNLN